MPTRTQHRQNNATHTRMAWWRHWRIFAWILAAVIVVGLGVALWPRDARDIAKYQLDAAAPVPAAFTDDITSDFVATDGAALPDVNNRRRVSAPTPLVIDANLVSGPYAPAFRMDLTNPDLNKNIKITPFIKGQWHPRGPSSIVFFPETDWPADTRFTVQIPKDVFNGDARIKSRQTSFKTADITAKIDSFATYPDTKSKKSVTGVAIISFNYAIDTHDFADKVSLRLDDRRLDFTAKFDKFRRTAFITSAPVTVTDTPQVMRLKLNRIPAAAGDTSTAKATAETTVESADNFFKVSDIEATTADDRAGVPQQLILISTTAAAAAGAKWPDFVTAYLLPAQKTPTDEDTPHKWSADEITPDVLSQSTKLALTPVEFATATGVYRYALSFDVSEKQDRFMYIDVKPGIDSAAGFSMSRGISKVVAVPYPTRSVRIAGSGALLSLAGDRKLGIVARGGVDAAFVNLYKVKADEINHLISQTYNVFSDMQFKSWAFDAYDMAVVFKKKIPFSDTSAKRVNYASVDLGDYLDRTHADKTGIFIVQTGTSQNQADYNDKRLILLTDLGIIRKVNMDQSTTLFVSNLSSGDAAGDVAVSVLGRNGNAVWAGRTDEGGRADIPALPWSEYRNEKEPVAIVARRGDDVSFMPYSNAFDRQVEYSKFDVDGVYASATTNLNAFLFTDRGIYRPGETAIIGAIVKNRKFKSLAGVPVKLEIRNSRGRVALEKTMSLGDNAVFDVKFAVPADAPLGEYNITLYSLNSKNKINDMIGTASMRVEEFVPDNLKITAEIAGADDNGWVSPENLAATVTLHNLFGTPATDKRVSATAVLVPTRFTFPGYAGYEFTDNYLSGGDLAANRGIQTIGAEIPDTETDSDGNARINIAFDDVTPGATYEMRMTVTGFEGASGRGVQTGKTVRVSDAKYLIGYKPSGALDYVNRNAARSVNVIAIDHTGTPTTVTDLTLQLVKRENLVSLVKDGDGFYKYQTVKRDRTISTQNLTVPASGTQINLDTGNGGTYFLQITDAGGRTLANIEYFVAEDENTAMRTDTDAALGIKLSAAQYAPGDDIAISITAPYAGTGLVTIERDRVYAYRWFKTTSTSSVQHIKIPADFEGTGYINVSFVRDINSRDIFTTPYAYAVAPFMSDVKRRTIDVKLDAPKTVRDGHLAIEYETDKAADLMIFAVNTGILQVAKYQIPNPIAHFFKKAALQVDTFQILSLLLPEYKVLREFAKTGGGDFDGGLGNDAITTNPFGRRTDAPVAFYSGIIKVAAGKPGQITFDIPDQFNGEIKVFAVAAGATSLGAASTDVRVLSPIVISANAPLYVAPNDTFDVNAVVSNLTETRGDTTFRIHVTQTPNLEITTTPAADIQIAQNAEKLWTFGARATDGLGNAELTVAARAGDLAQTRRATMSVRPTTVFETNAQTGLVDKKKTQIRGLDIPMYSEFSNRKIYISGAADVLTRPLVAYLDKYEFPCSEQLVSRAMPYALMAADAADGDASKKIEDTINILKTRQNDDGSFALWAATNVDVNNASRASAAYVTAYVVQFLTIARENGFGVPENMLGRGVDFLRTYAGGQISDDRDAAAHAFAIYLITRNNYVSTGYIDTFKEYADKNIKAWPSRIMGAYVAAAYKIMKQDDAAYELISKYKMSKTDKFEYVDEFDNNVANDAAYSYIRRRYFDMATPEFVKSAAAYINRGEYGSFTAAMVTMGLGAGNADTIGDRSITVRADGREIALARGPRGNLVASIPDGAAKIDLECADCAASPLYYATVIQGFPKTPRNLSDGIEVIREYYDANGDRITSGNIGDMVTVKIFARARGGADTIENVVITDLLPGGITADTDMPSGTYDYAEIREDRVLIFTTLGRGGTEFTYNARLTTSGTFAVAPVYAASMYNTALRAANGGGKFTVKNATVD